MNATSTMNADLHCHSTMSDGWLTPSEVVARALRNGVTMLALTDHDEVGGLDEALRAALHSPLTLIPGVEISVSFMDETIHIVGLNIDHRHPGLVAGLTKVRAGRHARAEKMDAELAAIGIHGVLAGARGFARNPELVGRAHFARQLVAMGMAADVGAVFRHYLARGKPGFVDHVWADLGEAVGWIRDAGGVAVVAHPARYRLSDAAMGTLFDTFIDHGGEAVEVVSGAHSPADVLRFARLARRRGLLASRASDFHGEAESAVDLGACAPLPADLVPVWTRWSAARPPDVG